MEQTIRTFIAVKIVPEMHLTETLIQLQEELSEEAIKWVKPDNLHVTLRFLGDSSHQQVEQVKTMLEKVTAKHMAFEGTLKGLDYFKSKGNPRVLFAGIFDNNQLKKIAEGIESELSKTGFERENRSFKPHLTLARIRFLKNKKAFYQLIDKFIDTEFQTIRVGEVILYQSKLKPGGAIYHPLQISKLKNRTSTYRCP